MEKTETVKKTVPRTQETKTETEPEKRVVHALPKQSYISQDKRSGLEIGIKNKWDDFLYKVG